MVVSPYDPVAQKAANQSHLLNPQVGDFWHEMFCGVAYVIAVSDETVTFLDQKIDVDDAHYRFDETKPRALSRDEFANWLRYNSEALKNETWADVRPAKQTD